MKLSHTKLIVISGLVWFAVGIYLLYIGLNLLANIPVNLQNYSLVQLLKPYAGTLENAALMLVVLGLVIGYFKGRYVLGKSARRGVERIMNMSNPAPLNQIYSAKYYVLLGMMVALGVSIKYMGIDKDIRGLVDVAIGAALINGAMIYFRLAQETSKKNQSISSIDNTLY
jgi:hypothetical protein